MVASGSNTGDVVLRTGPVRCRHSPRHSDLVTPKQTGVAQISLAAGGTPVARTGHALKVRARVTAGPGTSTIRAALYEGGTNRSGDLESTGLTTSLAEYTLAIPDASAANITSYANLEIRLWGYNADGTARTFEVDQVWLEVPAAVPPASPYAAEIMADGPVAYYRMGEASGAAQDSTANGNHTNAPVGTPTYGRPGISGDGNQAISLPGTGGSRFGVFPVSVSLQTVNDVFTLEAWVKLSALGQIHGLISMGVGGAYMRVNSNNKLQLVRSFTLGMEESTVTLDTGWHHVVVTKSGATHKLYIDGVDRTGTATGDSTCVTDPSRGVTLGSDDGGGEVANAVLDELAIYPTALSAARVAAHYAAGQLPGAAYTRTPADTFGLTDARTVARSKLARSETFGLTDARSRIAVFKRTPADIFGLTDARRATHVVVQPDAFGLTDARSRVAAFKRSRPDIFGLTDARTLIRAVKRAVADIFGLTDARTRVAAFKRSRPDTFGLTDTATPVKTTGGAARTRSVADTFGLTDARARARGKRLSDTFGLTDAEREARGKTLADAFGLTDARARARGKRVADVFGLTDAERETRGKRIADALGLTDARAKVSALRRAVANVFGLTDARRATHIVVKPDTFGLTDARTRVATYHRTRPDTFGLTDSCSAAKTTGGVAKTQGIADTLGLTDAGLVTWTANRSTDEQFGLTDAITPVRTIGSHAWTRTVPDAFGLTDARTRTTQTKRTVADGFGLTDARRATHIVVKPDQLGLTDARARSIGYRRARADTFGLTDARSITRRQAHGRRQLRPDRCPCARPHDQAQPRRHLRAHGRGVGGSREASQRHPRADRRADAAHQLEANASRHPRLHRHPNADPDQGRPAHAARPRPVRADGHPQPARSPGTGRRPMSSA